MKKEMKIHHCEQNSEEWHELRLGRLTASKASSLLVKGKDNGIGAGMKSYIYKKAAERITGQAIEMSTNAAMQRGHDLEPIAREVYQEETYNTVDQVGFISLNQYIGFSPDGLVDQDGGVEIKCPMQDEYMKMLDNPTDIPKDHFAQMQFGMWVSGRSWWDYVRYHPLFGEKKLMIHRVLRDESMMRIFEQKAAVFASEMERLTAYMYKPELA
jgi:hypothetical protein